MSPNPDDKEKPGMSADNDAKINPAGASGGDPKKTDPAAPKESSAPKAESSKAKSADKALDNLAKATTKIDAMDKLVEGDEISALAALDVSGMYKGKHKGIIHALSIFNQMVKKIPYFLSGFWIMAVVEAWNEREESKYKALQKAAGEGVTVPKSRSYQLSVRAKDGLTKLKSIFSGEWIMLAFKTMHELEKKKHLAQVAAAGAGVVVAVGLSLAILDKIDGQFKRFAKLKKVYKFFSKIVKTVQSYSAKYATHSQFVGNVVKVYQVAQASGAVTVAAAGVSATIVVGGAVVTKEVVIDPIVQVIVASDLLAPFITPEPEAPVDTAVDSGVVTAEVAGDTSAASTVDSGLVGTETSAAAAQMDTGVAAQAAVAEAAATAKLERRAKAEAAAERRAKVEAEAKRRADAEAADARRKAAREQADAAEAEARRKAARDQADAADSEARRKAAQEQSDAADAEARRKAAKEQADAAAEARRTSTTSSTGGEGVTVKASEGGSEKAVTLQEGEYSKDDLENMGLEFGTSDGSGQ